MGYLKIRYPLYQYILSKYIKIISTIKIQLIHNIKYNFLCIYINIKKIKLKYIYKNIIEIKKNIMKLKNLICSKKNIY